MVRLVREIAGTAGGRSRADHGPPGVRDVASAPRRSPKVRAYFEPIRRDDPQRKEITLVATAHYLVRVMWALLKHGKTWEEGHTAADGPNEPAMLLVHLAFCSYTHASRRSGSEEQSIRRTSGPER
jgi:hypothetical protein